MKEKLISTMSIVGVMLLVIGVLSIFQHPPEITGGLISLIMGLCLLIWGLLKLKIKWNMKNIIEFAAGLLILAVLFAIFFVGIPYVLWLIFKFKNPEDAVNLEVGLCLAPIFLIALYRWITEGLIPWRRRRKERRELSRGIHFHFHKD